MIKEIVIEIVKSKQFIKLCKKACVLLGGCVVAVGGAVCASNVKEKERRQHAI